MILNTFLKVKGLASSGGEAKTLIRSEKVLLNGEVETRNKKQLAVGDVITVDGDDFILKQEDIRT